VESVFSILTGHTVAIDNGGGGGGRETCDLFKDTEVSGKSTGTSSCKSLTRMVELIDTLAVGIAAVVCVGRVIISLGFSGAICLGLGNTATVGNFETFK